MVIFNEKNNSVSGETALIVGSGSGLSASLARMLSEEGYQVIMAARNIDKITGLADEIGAQCISCDATDSTSVNALFESIQTPLRVTVYNPSAMQRGALVNQIPELVANAIQVTAFGAFLCGQAATRIMLAQEPVNGTRGTILFTGASAGVKGFPMSAPFAMGKFAQRGLAQSMSRELHPQGIHVAWVNIDGGIQKVQQNNTATANTVYNMLDPDAIAQSYLHLIRQHYSAWSEEITLRPWVEKF